MIAVVPNHVIIHTQFHNKTTPNVAKSTIHSAAKCYNCGNSWPHLNAPCPAKGKQCKSCNRHGHFAKVLPLDPTTTTITFPFIARENIFEISTVAVAPRPRPLNPMTIFIRYIANTTNLQKCQKYIA